MRSWLMVVQSVVPRSVPTAATSAASESKCMRESVRSIRAGRCPPPVPSAAMTRRPSPGGILGGPVDGPARLAASYPAQAADVDILVLHRPSGFAGRIVRFDTNQVRLRGSTGLEKTFAVKPGDFAVEGRTVHLVPPIAAAGAGDALDLRGGTV